MTTVIASVASAFNAFTEAIERVIFVLKDFCDRTFRILVAQADLPRFARSRTETATGFFRKRIDPALANGLRHEAGMRPVPT